MRAIVLIGEMGSGKSYRGKLMAEQLGYPFIEGDALCGAEMQEAIENFRIISREMVDDLVKRMAMAIWVRQIAGYEGVVVAQALYLKEHRQVLELMLASYGISVEFVWVRVGFWRNIRQLWNRPSPLRWVLYWLMSKPFFQPPRAVRVLS